MTKSTPIILDRLAEALSKHGIQLKRQQLLGVAAAAFGHRSDKTFSAADAAGELGATVAHAAGVDDQGLCVIRDPVADALFAMDVEERSSRAGRWTVSPYGNLLDIGAIVRNPAKRADLLVYAATISHRHGVSFYVDVSEAGLQAQVAGFCDEWWDEARQADDDLPETTEGMADDDIVEAYFNAQTDEYIDRSSETIAVPRAVSTRYASPTSEAWVAMRLDLESDEPVSWWSDVDGWGDLASATVRPDANGRLPDAGDEQSVTWQRMPAAMVDAAATPTATGGGHAWERHTTERSAQIGAIAATEGLGIVPGVDFRIINTERMVDASSALGHRRRVLMQTGGVYDHAAAVAWRDKVEPEVAHAPLVIEVTDRYARVLLEHDGDMDQAGSAEDWIRAVTDLLTPAEGRDRILADFRPEAWVRNNAIEVDFAEAKVIDVTYEMLLIGREAALQLDTGDSDHLLEAVRATARVRDWSGPFTITVHDAVEESDLFGAGDQDDGA